MCLSSHNNRVKGGIKWASILHLDSKSMRETERWMCYCCCFIFHFQNWWLWRDEWEIEHHFGADEHNCNLWMIEIEFFLSQSIFDNEYLYVERNFFDFHNQKFFFRFKALCEKNQFYISNSKSFQLKSSLWLWCAKGERGK